MGIMIWFMGVAICCTICSVGWWGIAALNGIALELRKLRELLERRKPGFLGRGRQVMLDKPLDESKLYRKIRKLLERKPAEGGTK